MLVVVRAHCHAKTVVAEGVHVIIKTIPSSNNDRKVKCCVTLQLARLVVMQWGETISNPLYELCFNFARRSRIYLINELYTYDNLQ